MKTTLRFAALLLTAALALPAERDAAARSHAAKPSRKAVRVLGKVNPLRLLQRLDAATTDLALRFSSWHTDLPASEEMPKVAKRTAPPAGEPSFKERP
jgi:hypothetical protein